MVGNFKSFNWSKKIKKNASLSYRKTLNVFCIICSMSHDWFSLSHCPSKQSIHDLQSRLVKLNLTRQINRL